MSGFIVQADENDTYRLEWPNKLDNTEIFMLGALIEADVAGTSAQAKATWKTRATVR